MKNLTENLTKVVEELKGVIKEMYENCADSQVIFSPKQITSPEQIMVGRTYSANYMDNKSTEEITILEKDLEGGQSMKVQYADRTVDVEEYADLGMIPYENGNWNPTNYLVLKE